MNPVLLMIRRSFAADSVSLVTLPRNFTDEQFENFISDMAIAIKEKQGSSEPDSVTLTVVTLEDGVYVEKFFVEI